MKVEKEISLYSMAALHVIAGINHFVNPDFYKMIMPPWLPWHYSIIFISGLAEIVLGLLLLPLQTRKLAAWGIIILLVAIFPANVQMMLNYQQEKNPDWWIAVVRLPLQLLLIVWVYQFAKSDRR